MNKDMYIALEVVEPLARCPVCGSIAKVWQYSESRTSPTTKVVMCSHGEEIGPQQTTAGIVTSGCLLYMPPDDFYRPTIREAIVYWNAYASALKTLRHRNAISELAGTATLEQMAAEARMEQMLVAVMDKHRGD